MHIIAKSLLSLLLILTLSLQPVMGAQINDSIFMSPQADPYSLALRSGLGDLNIESRQDTSTYDRDSWGLNLGLNLGGGSGQAGQLGDIVEGVTSNPSADSLSIGGSFGKGEGESHWVETQAGISGDTLNIDVEGNTNLKGGTIIAENEEASSLETGTLTHSNIADKHIREDIDVSANIGIGGNGLSGSVDGGYEFTAREQDNKATANIEITITDQEAQDQLVEDGVTEDLAALNTDPDQAQVITRDERNAVDFYVSDQAVKAVGEAAKTLIDNLEKLGQLTETEAERVKNVLDKLDEVDAESLALCTTGGNSSGSLSPFRFMDLFISTAYAARDFDLRPEVPLREQGYPKNQKRKKLYVLDQSDQVIRRDVEYINSYLAHAKDAIVEGRNKSLSDISTMLKGNQPTDGGYLCLARDEAKMLTVDFPDAERYVYKYRGSRELIRGQERYCLWIEESDAHNAGSIRNFGMIRGCGKNSKGK